MGVTVQAATPPALAKLPAQRRWLGVVVPAVLLFGWWAATRNTEYGLIPSPGEVVTALVDLASATRATHSAAGWAPTSWPRSGGCTAPSCWPAWWRCRLAC